MTLIVEPVSSDEGVYTVFWAANAIPNDPNISGQFTITVTVIDTFDAPRFDLKIPKQFYVTDEPLIYYFPTISNVEAS